VRFRKPVLVFCVLEPFESLVDQNIMNHEVTKAICCDSKSYKEQIVKTSLNSIVEKNDTRNSKKSKKISLRSKILAYSADDDLHENTT
jgi:hypothetical protein